MLVNLTHLAFNFSRITKSASEDVHGLHFIQTFLYDLGQNCHSFIKKVCEKYDFLTNAYAVIFHLRRAVVANIEVLVLRVGAVGHSAAQLVGPVPNNL